MQPIEEDEIKDQSINIGKVSFFAHDAIHHHQFHNPAQHNEQGLTISKKSMVVGSGFRFDIDEIMGFDDDKLIIE